MAIIELKALSALLAPTHVAYEGPYEEKTNELDEYFSSGEGSKSNGWYKVSKHHGLVAAIGHLAIKNKGLGFIMRITPDGNENYCCGRDEPLNEESVKFWEDESKKMGKLYKDLLMALKG